MCTHGCFVNRWAALVVVKGACGACKVPLEFLGSDNFSGSRGREVTEEIEVEEQLGAYARHLDVPSTHRA